MSRTVLIVDNHDALRRRIRSALEQAGLNICGEATNGQEAIQKILDLSPDVVILNISMPVMGGFQALPEIIRRAPSTKVVIFTVDDAEEFRRQALQLGAHAYVSKSAPIEELLAEVRKVLGKTS